MSELFDPFINKVKQIDKHVLLDAATSLTPAQPTTTHAHTQQTQTQTQQTQTQQAQTQTQTDQKNEPHNNDSHSPDITITAFEVKKKTNTRKKIIK